MDENLGKGPGRRESLTARRDSSGGKQAVRSEMLSGVVGESCCGSSRYKSSLVVVKTQARARRCVVGEQSAFQAACVVVASCAIVGRRGRKMKGWVDELGGS